ncbi:MAG TPA: M36 family metallopeptidase [Pyrinomonadaceae bacterium]|jgi:subtilisin-like proprotein convertase family protein
MKSRFKERKGWSLTIVAVGLVLLALAVLIPPPLRTQAAKQNNRQIASGGLVSRPGLENYDIRYTDKSDAGAAKLESLRQQAGQRAKDDASRAGREMNAARESLSSRVGQLRVELNRGGNAPEIVGVEAGCKCALTAPTNEAREPAVRSFLAQNSELYGLTENQVAELVTVADYTNPAGNLSWVEFEQRIGGIPVFQGYVRAALRKDGAIARTTGNLAAGLDYSALQTTPKMSASNAAASAARAIGVDVSPLSLRALRTTTPINDGRTSILAQGPFTENIKTDLVYFPTEPGVAVLAYSMLLWGQDADYYIIVDANDGQMLWRKNIRNEQTQSVTYNVYNDDNPAPLSPSNALPGSGIQGAAIARTDISVINEMPVGQPFSNDPWIADGAGNVTTTGNNVDAGLDIDGTNGVDASGRATGVGRVLSFIFNPAPGIPAPGDAPTSAAYRSGAVTNLFFWSNRYHDRLYQLGFTEQARNFQLNNYGRGGTGNDYVRAEAQDSSGTNNANFSTSPDGSLPRMQMYIFTGPTPDRDGDLDHDIVIHELTHGTSNRLHANASGLTTTQSGGMGEGWGDFYARALLSTADEDVNGIYPAGGYATKEIVTGAQANDNYYYGVRRFPYAVKTNVGGAGATRPGQPHNPLTYADIDPAQINVNDGAYNRGPIGSATATEVHNIGEVWCMMLLEVRARLISRMGHAAGNQRALQIVTDGMKLDPASPTLIQARDSILAADCASFNGEDEQDIWAGFATRGMGFGATTTGTATVTQSFAVPNLTLGTVTINDAAGNNNGAADPGETILLTVPLTNPFCGANASATTASITGGGSANYGTIIHGATSSQAISYTVPAATACGSAINLPIVVNSSLGQVTRNYLLRVGTPSGTTAPTTTGSGNISVPIPDVATAEVPINITDAGAIADVNVRLRLNHTFDGDLLISLIHPDGTSITLSDNRGSSGDNFGSGNNDCSGTHTVFDDAAATAIASGTAPYVGSFRPALPLNGLNGKDALGTWKLRVADTAAQDTGTIGCVQIEITRQGFACSPVNQLPPVRRPGDFDGDGLTDLLIFRPNEGNWYVRNSSDGSTTVQNWGLSTDKLVYGDYDGDGQGDFAIFRESEGNWYIRNSSDNTVTLIGWGQNGDRPAPADYDGDGKTDVAVYRPSDGNWYIKKSSGGSIAQGWGDPTDTLVPADYDVDGKADIAVFRQTEGNWYILKSTGGSTVTNWGLFGDKAVPGDYDGDRKADVAVFRPNEGNWYIKKSTGGSIIVNWGNSNDRPVPADYDGDGLFDIAIWRESEANFYIRNSATNTVSIINLGTTGDIPVIGALIP